MSGKRGRRQRPNYNSRKVAKGLNQRLKNFAPLRLCVILVRYVPDSS